MSGDWELTKEAFDELLLWLDRDRGQAGKKYESIRLGLIKMFTGRAYADAEELADETINRVAKKLPEIRDAYSGKPERYFYGVARMLYHEYQRRTRKLVPLPDDLPDTLHDRADEDARDDLTSDCMEGCMQKLRDDQRELLRQYYSETASTASAREALARRLGITIEALRVRVFRVVKHLEACVDKCKGDGE